MALCIIAVYAVRRAVPCAITLHRDNNRASWHSALVAQQWSWSNVLLRRR